VAKFATDPIVSHVPSRLGRGPASSIDPVPVIAQSGEICPAIR
jgi:hypothetical protein